MQNTVTLAKCFSGPLSKMGDGNTAGPFQERDFGGPLSWQGLHLDGTLVPLRPGWALGAKAVATPSLRAATMPFHHYTIIGRQSAAWVYTGLFPKTEATMLYRIGGNVPPKNVKVRYHRVKIHTSQIIMIGGRATTTVQKTALDCLLFGDRKEYALHIQGLQAHKLDLGQLRADVENYGRPTDQKRALRRLALLGI